MDIETMRIKQALTEYRKRLAEIREEQQELDKRLQALFEDYMQTCDEIKQMPPSFWECICFWWGHF